MKTPIFLLLIIYLNSINGFTEFMDELSDFSKLFEEGELREKNLLELANLKNGIGEEEKKLLKEMDEFVENLSEFVKLCGMEVPPIEARMISRFLGLMPKKYLDEENSIGEIGRLFWNRKSFQEFLRNESDYLLGQLNLIKRQIEYKFGRGRRTLMKILENFKYDLEDKIYERMLFITFPLKHLRRLKERIRPNFEEKVDEKLKRFEGELKEYLVEEEIVKDLVEYYSGIIKLNGAIRRQLLGDFNLDFNQKMKESIEAKEKYFKFQILGKCIQEAKKLCAKLILFSQEKGEFNLMGAKKAYLEVKGGLRRIGILEGIGREQAEKLAKIGKGEEMAQIYLELTGKPLGNGEMDLVEMEVLRKIGKLFKEYNDALREHAEKEQQKLANERRMLVNG